MRVLQVMVLPIILLSLYLLDVRHLFTDIMMVKERLVKVLQNKNIASRHQGISPPVKYAF